MSLPAAYAGVGLRIYSFSQWRVLRDLAAAHAEEPLPVNRIWQLRSLSERLGVLLEAQLVLNEITEQDYAEQLASECGELILS